MQFDSYVSDRRRKRKQRKKYLVFFLVLVLGYALLMSAVWFFYRSPVFRMSHVVVTGNNAVPSGDIVTLLQSSALRDHNFWHALAGFNNMMAWPSSLTPQELALVPQLATVSIGKDYWDHTLNVAVSEREPFGAWCFDAASAANEECYWFDNTGTIFAHAFDTQGNVVFTVYDDSQAPRGLNETVLPAEFNNNLISILNVVRTTGLAVKEIDLADLSLEEVHVILANGPVLEFSLRFSADNDLPVLQNVVMKLPNFTQLSYVDCRTENRVYYK